MITPAKRLQKEASQLKDSKDDSIFLVPLANNILEWKAIIKGPKDSYYDGFEFDLKITVPFNYPMVPPTIKFITKIFHPNVLFETGEICLDILKKEWSPAWNLQSSCRAIVALLADPAPDSPLNCDAGNILRANDTRAYRSITRMYCVEHGRPASLPC